MSEAIRRGCQGTYQVRGRFRDYKGGTCALGAALDGSNSKTDFNYILNRIAERECPVCGVIHQMAMIPTLNDDHGWTREAIADWVESIENQLEQARLTSPETRVEVVKESEGVHQQVG